VANYDTSNLIVANVYNNIYINYPAVKPIGGHNPIVNSVKINNSSTILLNKEK
jgi:hypothetical protein